MDFKETDVKELESRDHEVLGADFCSGYTDVFGKWNTGFDCPRAGNGETMYCCGTSTYKYCCTRREQQSSSGMSQSVIVGTAVGSVLLVILVTLVSCLICRRCVPYRRVAHTALNGGPLYRMHCSSTASGIYSFSGQTTTTTTPLDSTRVLLEMEHTYAVPLNGPRSIGRHLIEGVRGSAPSEPPPPYREGNELNHNSFALQSSSQPSERNSEAQSDSTKF